MICREKTINIFEKKIRNKFKNLCVIFVEVALLKSCFKRYVNPIRSPNILEIPSGHFAAPGPMSFDLDSDA